MTSNLSSKKSSCLVKWRIIAEKRKQKTDQLLYALPISSADVVIGKFTALMCVFLAPMLIICMYPLIFLRFGDVYLPTSYGSILAFIMLGMTLISIGMFISSLTESQGLAAGICVAVMLFIYYIDTLARTFTKEGVIVDTEAVPESYKVNISRSGNKEYYLRVDNSKIIYKIDQNLYDDLSSVTYHTIRPKNIVNPDWEKVSSLLVETGENTYEITQNKNGVYHLGENPLDMKNSIEKIKALAVADFEMKDMDKHITNALKKKPELSLTIRLNMKEYPELKIAFYSLNGTHSITQLNGETLGPVKRDDMSGLRESIIRAVLGQSS